MSRTNAEEKPRTSETFQVGDFSFSLAFMAPQKFARVGAVWPSLFSFSGEPPTCRAVAEHARLIRETDLHHPIILSADGRVSGRLLVPETLLPEEERPGREVTFGGTYRVSSALGELRFEHEEDTFVRDLGWVVGDGALVAYWGNGAEVRLERE